MIYFQMEQEQFKGTYYTKPSNMKHDFEYYLAYPFRWLASWASVEYSGEWRNACAAHIFAGWALCLTLATIWFPLALLVIVYPIYREWNDAKGWKFNKKNYADLLTFYVGEILGFIIWITTR